MQIRHRTLLVALPAVVLLFFGANANAAAKLFEGRKLFTTYCLVCHGETGKGNGPLAAKLRKKPADLTAQTSVENSDRDLFRTIDSGVKHKETGEGMPRWGSIMPETSIDALVSYVRFLQRSKHALLGDPEVGRLVYANYCATCHGETGKGDGALSRMLPFKPADHTDAKKMGEMTNDHLVKVVSNGVSDSYMPGWKNILSEPEIRAVVSYVRLLSK
jgi:cytochrome c oxidase cbb3-type subunit III